MSNNVTYNENDLNNILEQLKSNKSSTQDNSTKHICMFINQHRENPDEIIKRLGEFLDGNCSSIPDSLLIKIITKVLKVLVENNVPINNFINKVFCTLTHIIFMDNRTLEQFDLIIQTIGNLISKCDTYASQLIESQVSSIFKRFKNEQNFKYDYSKYALISLLKEFVRNSSVIAYNQIIENHEFFMDIVSNYKNAKEHIRFASTELIREFLMLLSNRDIKIREDSTKKIFDIIDKDLRNNNSDPNVVHGIILVFKACTVRREFFNDKYFIAMDYLSKNKNHKSIQVKMLIIEVIPFFADFLKEVFEENYLETFCSFFIGLFNSKIPNEMKNQILITFGKLSLIISPAKYEAFAYKIIPMIKIDLEKNQTTAAGFCNNVLDCLACFLKNFKNLTITKIPVQSLIEKMFSCGFNESHIVYLKQTMALYDNNNLELIKLLFVVLNVISLIINTKHFSFKYTAKKLNIKIFTEASDVTELTTGHTPAISNPSSKDNETNDRLSLGKSYSQPLDDGTKDIFNKGFVLSTSNKDMIEVRKCISAYNHMAKSKPDYTKIMNTLMRNALIFLKDINHPSFSKDILIYYQKYCLKLLENSDMQIKQIVIELAKSYWIPFNPISSLPQSVSSRDSKGMIDTDSNYIINILLDSYLNLILSEPSDELKILMLEQLDERYDYLLSENRFFNKLTFILNFDDHDIRENAIKIIGRIINLNYTTVILFVKKSILEIFVTLEISQNLFEKEDAIVLLSYFVKYTGVHIIDYIEQIFSTLIKILKTVGQLGEEVPHSNDMLNISILSIVSDLIKNTYEKKVQTEIYYKDILIICIGNLKKNSSGFKQEISLRTILAILENSDKDWRIHFDFIELVTLLIQILIRTTNKSSRVYALKIFGFIGAMDPDKLEYLWSLHKIQTDNNSNEYYEVDGYNNFDDGHFMNQHQNSELMKKSNPNGPVNSLITDKKKTFDYQKYINQNQLDTCTYQAVSSLMNILNDVSQQDLGNKAIINLKDLLASLNSTDNAIIYLILPTLINIIGNYESTSRNLIINYLTEIITKYRSESRQYIPEISAIIAKYITEKDYQEKMLRLLKSILKIYLDDIEPYLSKILPIMLSLLHEKTMNSNENDSGNITQLRINIFEAMQLMSSKLSNYLHLVLPETLTLLNTSMNEKKYIYKSQTITEETRPMTRSSNDDHILYFIDSIVQLPTFGQQMPKIIAALLKYLEINPTKGDLIMNIFMKILNAFRKEFITFLPLVIKTTRACGMNMTKYSKEMKYALEKEEKMHMKIDKDDDNANYRLKKNMISGRSSVNPNTSSVFAPPVDEPKSKVVNRDSLINEFNPNNCSIEEDWYEWFKSSSKSLFLQSPSSALLCCLNVSESSPALLSELYNYAFMSVWKTLSNEQKELLKCYLDFALEANKTPTEILLTILNLAEFIEREENHIEFIKFDKLGHVADLCKAYAKALYYVENDFRNNNDYNLLERLITLYYDLKLPESAIGILEMARLNNQALNEEDCYLKLHKWKEALEAINKKKKGNNYLASNDKGVQNNELNKTEFICLDGLSDWEKLLSLGNELEQSKMHGDVVTKMAPTLAKASLNLGEWEKLQHYNEIMDPEEDEEIYENHFFQAVLSIKAANYQNAKGFIEHARNAIDDKIKTLLSESYQRAYKLLIANEHLYELEEIIEYNNGNNRLKKDKLKQQWDSRLEIIDRDIKTYERILAIRGLVFNLDEDYKPHLDLAKICRREDRFTTCMIVLNRLKKRLEHSGRNVSLNIDLSINKCLFENSNQEDSTKAIENMRKIIDSKMDDVDDVLKSKTYCYYAQWVMQNEDKDLTDSKVKEILKYLELSTKYNEKNYKAWHCYGLLNYKFFEMIFNKNEQSSSNSNDISTTSPNAEKTPIIPLINPRCCVFASNAIKGFTTSVCIGGKNISKTLQDLLRLIDIWFQVGSDDSLNDSILKSFQQIQLESWLLVIPQLLARVGVNNERIRSSLVKLLKKIGTAHPSSLNYPLIVMYQTKSPIRSMAAGEILTEMNKFHENLIKECDLIIQEFNRCALLLHEEWREAIDESAKLCFHNKDIQGMIKILMNVHAKMDCEPETMNEVHFHQMYRGELTEAKNYLNDYLQSRQEINVNQAWELYHSVYQKILLNFPGLNYLDLDNVSPKLAKFKESEISVPGMYKSGSLLVKISGFDKQLTVLNSKQHPRKIIMYGSDGKEYMFLLKGHEDLRQDERAMQLFGLVNTLLSNNPDTSQKNLFIKRFPVIPLSHNTGIIGWVPNCDTLNQLIKEYRMVNKVKVNIENILLDSCFNKFKSATFMTKLEIFRNAMNRTLGLDLYKVLWKKSKNSETWLERRTNYSRSLAVMSMVGYILGLGDRHTSNIMLDRKSAKILHIDFGDCFEVAMKRDKFPEKVPFRLTRMLIKALEVSGIEGTFRITCENVMKVLRANKDSLIALLTAFVHDPLISFRLLIPLIMKANKAKKTDKKMDEKETSNEEIDENEYDKKTIGSTERQLYDQLEEKEEIESDELNKIAKLVLERIIDKLQGTDFIKTNTLTIVQQVEKLIKQATSDENLCQSYLGWCPCW